MTRVPIPGLPNKLIGKVSSLEKSVHIFEKQHWRIQKADKVLIFP